LTLIALGRRGGACRQRDLRIRCRHEFQAVITGDTKDVANSSFLKAAKQKVSNRLFHNAYLLSLFGELHPIYPTPSGVAFEFFIFSRTLIPLNDSGLTSEDEVAIFGGLVAAKTGFVHGLAVRFAVGKLSEAPATVAQFGAHVVDGASDASHRDPCPIAISRRDFDSVDRGGPIIGASRCGGC